MMVPAVRMERTGSRSRSFSGSVVIDASPDDVWAVITDYDRAADIVPTLTSSRRLPSADGAVLVEQVSRAPNLPGLNERQLTVMRMVEGGGGPAGGEGAAAATRTLKATLHDSKMFSSFEGEWRVTPLGGAPSRVELAYDFELSLLKRQLLLKGPQLLLLTEARIKKETPGNLEALKKAAEGSLAGYQVSRA